MNGSLISPFLPASFPLCTAWKATLSRQVSLGLRPLQWDQLALGVELRLGLWMHWLIQEPLHSLNQHFCVLEFTHDAPLPASGLARYHVQEWSQLIALLHVSHQPLIFLRLNLFGQPRKAVDSEGRKINNRREICKYANKKKVAALP